MKPTQFEALATLEKGIAKLQRGERVLASRIVSEDRMVRISAKITTVVKADDARSDEEVRADWFKKYSA